MTPQNERQLTAKEQKRAVELLRAVIRLKGLIEYPDKVAPDNEGEAEAIATMLSGITSFLNYYDTSSLSGLIPNSEQQLITACKYGYEYHQTSQFPELKFEEMAINNFKQVLQSGEFGLIPAEDKWISADTPKTKKDDNGSRKKSQRVI